MTNVWGGGSMWQTCGLCGTILFKTSHGRGFGPPQGLQTNPDSVTAEMMLTANMCVLWLKRQ